MNKVASFRNLQVWGLAMDTAIATYKLSGQLPKHEMYALSDQIRRSAVSVPSNIAEGSKRNSRREYFHFCGIAQGSAAELETQILLIKAIYPAVDTANLLENIERIQMMLTKLRQKLIVPSTTDKRKPATH